MARRWFKQWAPIDWMTSKSLDWRSSALVGHEIHMGSFEKCWILGYTPDQFRRTSGFWGSQCTPLQYSCLENPMDGGAWWAAVHGVAKSQTWLSNFTFTFHFHALEKEMATHSSVLAWRIPGSGELGGLPSLGSHRVGLKRLNSSSSSSNPQMQPRWNHWCIRVTWVFSPNLHEFGTLRMRSYSVNMHRKVGTICCFLSVSRCEPNDCFEDLGEKSSALSKQSLLLDRSNPLSY